MNQVVTLDEVKQTEWVEMQKASYVSFVCIWNVLTACIILSFL